MNSSQKAHLNRITQDVLREVTDKYVAGTKEYGTDLSKDYSELQLVEEAYKEALDQLVYLHTLREKLRKARHDR